MSNVAGDVARATFSDSKRVIGATNASLFFFSPQKFGVNHSSQLQVQVLFPSSMPSSGAAQNKNHTTDSTPSIPLTELRVADQELLSGNTSGRVFQQLSRGAVAFPVDRPVAQARVSRQIQQHIAQEADHSK